MLGEKKMVGGNVRIAVSTVYVLDRFTLRRGGREIEFQYVPPVAGTVFEQEKPDAIILFVPHDAPIELHSNREVENRVRTDRFVEEMARFLAGGMFLSGTGSYVESEGHEYVFKEPSGEPAAMVGAPPYQLVLTDGDEQVPVLIQPLPAPHSFMEQDGMFYRTNASPGDVVAEAFTAMLTVLYDRVSHRLQRGQPPRGAEITVDIADTLTRVPVSSIASLLVDEAARALARVTGVRLSRAVYQTPSLMNIDGLYDEYRQNVYVLDIGDVEGLLTGLAGHPLPAPAEPGRALNNILSAAAGREGGEVLAELLKRYVAAVTALSAVDVGAAADSLLSLLEWLGGEGGSLGDVLRSARERVFTGAVDCDVSDGWEKRLDYTALPHPLHVYAEAAWLRLNGIPHVLPSMLDAAATALGEAWRLGRQVDHGRLASTLIHLYGSLGLEAHARLVEAWLKNRTAAGERRRGWRLPALG